MKNAALLEILKSVTFVADRIEARSFDGPVYWAYIRGVECTLYDLADKDSDDFFQVIEEVDRIVGNLKQRLSN